MNRVFEGKHWAVLAMMVSSVGMQLAGLDGWHEASRPAFVSGLLLTIGAGITGLFVRAPEKKDSL